MAVPADSILYAKSHADRTDGDATTAMRQVWVYGGKRMRWLEADSEEVYAKGKGDHAPARTARSSASRTCAMVPNEIFRAGALLEAAKSAKGDRADQRTATPTSCAGASSPARRTGPRSR